MRFEYDVLHNFMSFKVMMRVRGPLDNYMIIPYFIFYTEKKTVVQECRNKI